MLNQSAFSPQTSQDTTVANSGSDKGRQYSLALQSPILRSPYAAPDSRRPDPVFLPSHTQKFSYIETALSRLALSIVPSYLQRLFGREPIKLGKLHDIAALDGLRGWACLAVFNFHFLFIYTWKVSIGWGFNNENFGIHQLPIIHIFTSGHIMVAIFFVISGYVLSYRPVKLIREGSWEQMLTALASSTLRRWLRLYIPTFVGTFLVFIAVRAGAYNYTYSVIDDGHTIMGTNEQHPPKLETSYDQIWDWYATMARLMNFWEWETFYNNYNPHLWTIPVEFRSSMILFLSILATCRLKTVARMTLVSCVIWYCICYGRWDVVLFLSGMLMAEMDLIQASWDPSSEKSEDIDTLWQILRPFRRYFWIFICVIGLYIGSAPNIGLQFTPGYMWLAKVIPESYLEMQRFPQSIGAILIVCSINNSQSIQKLFTNALSHYLGQISYAFYVVHGPILHSLGYTIMPSIWRLTGKETNSQFCFGLLIGWSICLPVSFWAGDLFWRMVDIPSVKFARWLEDKLTEKNGVERSFP